jgi:hypothetical protein
MAKSIDSIRPQGPFLPAIHSWGRGPASSVRELTVPETSRATAGPVGPERDIPNTFREAEREAITNHGKRIATPKSKNVDREKTRWTAGRSLLREAVDLLFSSKSIDTILFPFSQPPFQAPFSASRFRL